MSHVWGVLAQRGPRFWREQMAGQWNWGDPGWGRARSLLCGAVWPRQAPAVIQSQKGAPPGRWLEAQPRTGSSALPWRLHRGDFSVSSTCGDSAPEPTAQTMSVAARKAEVLADPSGAQTASLAMGQTPCQLPPTCSPCLAVHPPVLRLQVDIPITQACRVPQGLTDLGY